MFAVIAIHLAIMSWTPVDVPVGTVAPSCDALALRCPMPGLSRPSLSSNPFIGAALSGCACGFGGSAEPVGDMVLERNAGVTRIQPIVPLVYATSELVAG